MKKQVQNSSSSVAGRIIALLLVLGFLFFSTYAFWDDYGIKDSSISAFSGLDISEWLLNTDVNRLNERVASLIEADSLLAWDENLLWIAGDKTDKRSPVPELPATLTLPNAVLKAGTVFVWQNAPTSVVAAQITKDIMYEEYIKWFDSWDTLETALAESPYFIGGTAYSDFVRFYQDKLYTTAHAPVLFEGNYYLARHDNVLSTPEIYGNDDWFFVSGLYVPQDYPSGSIVEHNGRHFRKLSPSINGEPGKDAAGWKLLDYAPDGVREIAAWSNNQVWKLNDIVLCNGQYYVCILDGNRLEPDLDLPVVWEELPEYHESRFAVPDWEQNSDYLQNDVVVYQDEYYLAQENIYPGQESPDINSNWQHVVQYISGNTVPAYASDKIYEPYAFVSCADSSGVTGYYVSPDGNNNALPGDKNGPWIPVSSWNEETSGVEDWNEDRQYIDRDLGMFAYYAGEIYRFEGKNPPKGKAPPNQANSWTRIPKWSEIAGNWRGEETICSKLNNKYIVWKLNADKFFTTQNQPQEPVVGASGNNDWIQYEKEFASQYVYTTYGGRIVLWYSEQPSNIVPGAADSPWREISYKTNNNYVYTVNAAGAIKVWYSQNKSSVPPGANLAEWTELYSSMDSESFPYFYITKEEKTYYYETRVIGTDGSLQLYLPGKQYVADSSLVWFETSQTWIGGNSFVSNQNESVEKNAVAYYWNSRNIYLPGEIVVYGTTKTNTYSYYRLRENADPYEATGREPSSYSGYLYWEPLNIIGQSN